VNLPGRGDLEEVSEMVRHLPTTRGIGRAVVEINVNH